MKVSLPPPGSWRRLGVAVAVSLLIHVGLFALGFVLKELAPRVVVKKGEPLFVELPKPEEEAAPRGNPALPVAPRPQPVRPPVAKSPPPAPKPTPRVETVRPAPKPEPAKPSPEPAPSQVAKVAPLAEPEGAKAAPQTPKEEAKPEPSAPSAGEARVALAKPPEGERPGGGGGLRGGRGGIEGEPIPLNTTDPRYTDYFDKIRRRIKENWIYPREAGERGIGGQLVIEFAIRKDGGLQFVDLKRSSGVAILDQYALNALKLAQPFPPVPDSVSKGPLPIAGIFTYHIVDSGLLNQYLR